MHKIVSFIGIFSAIESICDQILPFVKHVSTKKAFLISSILLRAVLEEQGRGMLSAL